MAQEDQPLSIWQGYFTFIGATRNHCTFAEPALACLGFLQIYVSLISKFFFIVGAGILRNGIALVRPPGHHAEHDQPLGFCFFNNVAIAAKQYRRLFNKRVLILDWVKIRKKD